MSLAWLIDPQHQFMTKSGTINVGGTIRVFEAVTDDPVLTFKDFTGTENELSVVLDSNGRANVIADPAKAYRVEVYDRYGTLMWTAAPVWCLDASGDGATGTEVISSDGSISVVKTVTGGMTQFDISNRVDDSTDLLEWIASSGDSEYHDGAFHLVYNAGTMEIGERGIRLGARRYYHVTAEVTAGKDVVHPVYDNIDFVLYFRDGEGDLAEVTKFSRVGDYSMGLSQCWTVACDCMPETDVELVLRVEGKDLDDTGGFTVTRFDVHRVFSGAPALPGGAVSKNMLEECLVEKQDVIDDLSEIRAGAEAGSTAVQPGDLATVATSGSYNDLNNKPNLSGFATKSEVTSGLATKQDTLIAGNNITIVDNVISATGGGGGGGGSSYTAGEGINIQNDEISVDTSVIQEKLSTTEMDAVDSGINSTKVDTYDTHVADTTIHVTSTDKTNWNAKEDASNKKQSIDDSSTTDYPSSKAVADFVNSSVATATARFLGSFTLTSLGLSYGATNAQIATALDNHTWLSGTSPTNNDYVYVEIQDPQTTGIDDEVRRFKFNGTVWAYEYTLNNSSFTAAEKAAIDSGITSNLVSTYSGHVADSTIHVTSSDKSTWDAKQNAISDLSDIRSGASAGATAVQPGDLATVAFTGTYSDLTGKPTIPAAQVNADWDASSGVEQILNKPNVMRIIPGTLSISATSAELVSICENILQYDGDDYMGLIRGPVQLDYYSIDALWTLVEIDDSDPDGIFIYFNFTFQRGVQLFWFVITYDTNREIASSYTFTQVLSVFDPVPGNCIRYNDNDNTINWHTTAGITDIQRVAALPANPVSTVLYLIPAT